MPVISPESVKNNNTSCYTCIGGPIAEMANYLRLVFSPNGQQKYAVDIYIGQNYKITFYDPYTQNNKTIIGTISGISNEAIAVYTVSVIDQNGNVCLCANKDNLAGYIGTETYHIPINNIQKIQLYTGNENPSERCETIVSILGISSTVIHSIIVRLRIFNDDVCSTVTPVDMVVGNIYNVVWCKDNTNTIYEITGRLIQIKEIPQFGDESTESGYVRQDNTEVVGMNDNIYDSRYFHSLPKCNPDGTRIQFVFDTSRDFNKTYDTVMLKDIRNVRDVSNPYPPPPYPPIPPCPPPYPHCPPNPGWPPCYGPSDMPPGWTPGDDPVDPGFSRVWTPTNPLPSDTTGTPTYDSSTSGAPNTGNYVLSNNLYEKVDPEFYK